MSRGKFCRFILQPPVDRRAGIVDGLKPYLPDEFAIVEPLDIPGGDQRWH